MTTVEIDEARVATLRDLIFTNRGLDVSLSEANIIAREAVTAEALDDLIAKGMAADKAERDAERAEREAFARVLYGTASDEDQNAFDDANVRAVEAMQAWQDADKAEAAAQRERIREALKASEKFDGSKQVRP